jgi:hypothetical protein
MIWRTVFAKSGLKIPVVDQLSPDAEDMVCALTLSVAPTGGCHTTQQLCDVAGSNIEPLVGVTGFEPATSSDIPQISD